MLISFAIYDNAGAPLTSASPAFVRYLDAAGNPAVTPAIANLGGGLYGFEAPTSDYLGRVYLVSTGGLPDYTAGSFGSAPLVAFALYDAAGLPTASAVPSFTRYADGEGSVRVAPAIENVGSGLYLFRPTVDDVEAHTAYLLTTGAFPSSLAGAFGPTDFGAPLDVTPPVVSGFMPPPGTHIRPHNPLGFTITDDSGVLRRVVLTASFPDLESMEVIHTGDAFGPQYTGTRTAVAGGYTYSGVIRIGGWPAAPTLTPYAFDIAGNEPI